MIPPRPSSPLSPPAEAADLVRRAIGIMEAAAKCSPGATAARFMRHAGDLRGELRLLEHEAGIFAPPPRRPVKAAAAQWRRIEWTCPRECVECGSSNVRQKHGPENGFIPCICRDCDHSFRLAQKILSKTQRQNLGTDRLSPDDQ